MPTEAVSVRTIFDRALEISTEAERAAYLDQACADFPAIRREVEALLQAHSEAGSFLQSPVLGLTAAEHPSTHSDFIGTQIGAYKLIQQIGEGGMGIVYMAQQERPVQRNVALKIIKPGMDSTQVIARFEAERQALALMDHPNIARVFDAGTTDSARPYFVMELVKGIPITQYADEHRLTPRQRLELFIPICQAVQHAHQKGIIHRDLKPTNVLVTDFDDRPVTKVIDFGVAKAIGQHLTEKTIFTQFGQVVGTIEYMSPEQAKLNQLDIDTRTDIYSLGVLLYELLTGDTPFDRHRLRSAAFDEMLRIIREEEPPKPSTRLSSSESLPSIAALRHLEPKKLTTLVSGDLDWIIMKALEKDRNRRYETAIGFARDIQRYLADEPVKASPPSALYQFGKFARRHKAGLAATSVILSFLMLLGAGVGWMSRDRAIRRHVVEDAASRALKEADDLQKRDKWQEALAAAERAKAALASGEAGVQLEQQVGERLADLQLIQRLEELRLKLGDEFDSGNQDRAYARLFTELGIDALKLSPAEIAARIRQRPAVAVRIAAALDHWSKVRRDKLLYQKGDPATWKRLLEAARIADPDPWRAQLRQLMGQEDLHALRQLSETADIAALPVQSLDLLGNALIFGHDPQACVAWLRKVQQQHPDDVLINFDLAYHLSNLPAPPWYDVVRFYQAALAARPQSAHLHLDLAAALIKAGQSDKTLGPTPEAVNALQEAGKILDEQAAGRPAAEPIQLFLGHILWELGDAWLERKYFDEAEHADRRAFTTFADLSARDPKNRYYRQETAYGYHKLAEIHAASGQLSISVDECRQAIPIYEALVTESPDNFFYREEAQHRYLELANCLKDAKQTHPAVEACRQAIELQSGMLKFGSEVPDWWDRGIWLGQTLRELGQFADAEQVLQEAVDLWTKLVAERNLEDRRFQLGRSYEDLGHVYNTQHRFDQAVESYRRALDIFTKLVNEFNKPNYKDRQSWTQQSILNVLVLQLQQANVDAQLTDEQRKTKAQELREQAVKLARDTIKTGWWANNRAWRLATGPDPQQRDPTLAIKLAALAVEHASDDAKGMFLNTLGVAQYRAEQWQSAIDALHESMNHRNGGDPADWFFLAMAHWQLGQKEEARQWYDRGVQWMKDNHPQNQELQRFQDEASNLLKTDDQKPANDQPTAQTEPKPANLNSR